MEYPRLRSEKTGAASRFEYRRLRSSPVLSSHRFKTIAPSAPPWLQVPFVAHRRGRTPTTMSPADSVLEEESGSHVPLIMKQSSPMSPKAKRESCASAGEAGNPFHLHFTPLLSRNLSTASNMSYQDPYAAHQRPDQQVYDPYYSAPSQQYNNSYPPPNDNSNVPWNGPSRASSGSKYDPNYAPDRLSRMGVDAPPKWVPLSIALSCCG